MWRASRRAFIATIFNIAINYLYIEICHPNFANKHEYECCLDSKKRSTFASELLPLPLGILVLILADATPVFIENPCPVYNVELD